MGKGRCVINQSIASVAWTSEAHKDSAQVIMAYRRYLAIGGDNERKKTARERIPALGGTL